MKNLAKSMAVVGQVIGLFIGSNLTTPVNKVMEEHINIALY